MVCLAAVMPVTARNIQENTMRAPWALMNFLSLFPAIGP